MSAPQLVTLSVTTYDLLHLGLDTSSRMLDAIRQGLIDAADIVVPAWAFEDMEALATDLRKLRGLLMLETDRTPVGID